MSTNVQAVINAAADEADSLLEGIVKPADARPLLLEWLGENHPELPENERTGVISKVLTLLEQEDFFTAGPADDSEESTEPAEPDE